MLVVFDLDWKRFDINDQVVAANNEMNGLARQKGVDFFISFNLASLGAGEWITLFPRKARPDPAIIDELRQHHWDLSRQLGEDENFKAYRDVAEMLAGMKSRDFQLAAVFTGTADSAERSLTRARVIDFFEERVYGGGAYRAAMDAEGAAPSETIVISDSSLTIDGIRFLRPRATIGYLDPHRQDQRIKLKELERASASYVVAGGASIPWYCDYYVRGKGTPKPR